MGSILEPSPDRTLEVAVTGGAALDYVELVKNGVALARRSASDVRSTETAAFRGKLAVAVGWGEASESTEWHVRLAVRRGRLLGVEPRFSGGESVAPRQRNPSAHQVSSWRRISVDEVEFATRTSPNPNTSTDGTQKLGIEIEGDDRTELVAHVNGRELVHSLGELRHGPRAGYLGGFVSSAFQLSRAVPEAEYRWSWKLDERGAGVGPDFYYVRVRQKNDQWAWSSPIWI